MTATDPAAARPADLAPRGAWLTLAVVAGGLFLAVMSTTVVSVALPTIGADLHATATDLQWIVDAYVLVYASFLVAGGVLGDRRGRKGLFLIGVVIFGLGSLITGLAPSLGLLLAGRVVQGLGPALLIPGSLTIIRATFENSRQRAAAIGLWSMASGLSLAVGPALGGLIVADFGWRWVFLFNVPLAGVLVLAAARIVPRLARTPAGSPFDWPGVILTIAAVGALSFAIIHGQVSGLTSPLVLAVFAAGAAALAGFVAWERRRSDPLVDVSLFARPAFTAANLAALVVFFSFIGAIVYFSAYFQQVQGHSPIKAGLDLSALGVAFAIGAPISGRLVGRVGPVAPMLTGLIIAGGATLALLRLEPHTGIAAIWWDFALVGGGTGLCLTPMTQIAVSAVGSPRAGMASAVHNALRQVGQVFGVAVLGLLVYGRLPNAGSVGRRLGPAQQSLFVDGLHSAMWVSGLALLMAAALAALLFWRRAATSADDGRMPDHDHATGPRRPPPAVPALARPAVPALAPPAVPALAPPAVPALPAEDYACGDCRLSYADITAEHAAAAIAAVPAAARALAAALPERLIRRRPAPQTWSVTEYVCHLRDVYATYTIRLHRTRTEDVPVLEPMLNDLRVRRFRYNELAVGPVLDELEANVAGFGDEAARVTPAGWDRVATRLAGETRTARWLARQAMHEGQHHLRDIRRVTDQVTSAD